MQWCALLAALGVTAAPKIHAASQTWTNAPVDNTWTNVLNWNSKAVPGGINMTGNTVNNDVATFTNPIPVSGIGGASQPIYVDDATIVSTANNGYRSRQVGSIIFDTTNCGAYVFSSPSPAVWDAPGSIETGILNVTHNGSITMTAPVTNSETFLLPILTRLPSSTQGIFNFVNNSTNINATMQLYSVTNDSANSRGTTFILDGANMGTNTIYEISAGAYAGGISSITKQGTGTWLLTGADIFRTTAPMLVNNGTLVVQNAAAFGSATNLTVVSNGVVRVDAAFLGGTTLALNIFTLNNGGTVRLNGTASFNSVAVSTALGTSGTLATTSASDVMTLSGAVVSGSSSSALHIAGPGTVALTQASTYDGKWSVDAGTLQLNGGSLGSGPMVNISAGATLDATPLGAYALTTAALSANGTGTTTATAATLMTAAGSTLDLASTTPGISLTFSPTSFSGDLTHPALYISSGTLSLGGNAFSISNAAATPLGIGTYQLIRQASGTVASTGNYSVVGVSGGGVAAGNVASIQVNGSEVDLVVSAYPAKNLVWTGNSANANWDVATDASFLNGLVYTVFNNSDKVTFNSVGLTNAGVTLIGVLAPGSLTVSNNSTYTFSGSGSIAGATSLVKQGTGTLVMDVVNTYAGGTIVSNGVFQLGVNNAVPGIGSGNVSIYGTGVLDLNGYNDAIDALVGNGTVDTVAGGSPELTLGNNDVSGTFSGALQNTAGTLALTKNGNGIQTLASSNSYAGATTINAGTLRAANYYALGAGLSAVTFNNGILDLATNVLVSTLTGTVGTIANNSTTTTNALVVTNTSTFGGLVADGSGGGGVSVLVMPATTLRFNAANTYSGGTILAAGAALAIGNGASSAGTGGIVASNGATISQPVTGAPSSGIGNNITTAPGALVTLTSGNTQNQYGNQFYGSANSTNLFSGGNMSVGGAGGVMNFSNFLGTVIVTNGELRMGTGAGPFGGDDTTFIFQGTGGMFTRDATIVHLGALFGNGQITMPSVTFSGTYWIGAKNVDSEYSGTIVGSNSIVKGGTARLTLDGSITTTNTDSSTYTNYVYSSALTFNGYTTVSNGVLALSVPAILTNCAGITLAGTTAILDATKMGYVSNYTDAASNPDSALITNGIFEVSSTPTPLLGVGQTLNGFGTIQGSLLVDNGAFLSPGLPTGVLNVSGNAEIAGAVTMSLNITNATTTNSELAAAAIIIDSTATLVVTNAGPGLFKNASFKLFSKPVSGFASVLLPATDPTGTTNYTWNNNLSLNGTITLATGGLNPEATNPTNITFSVSGSTLSLAWPADHTGWTLQQQTNSLTAGLGTNWVDVAGSAAANSATVTMDPTKPTVFYRLRF